MVRHSPAARILIATAALLIVLIAVLFLLIAPPARGAVAARTTRAPGSLVWHRTIPISPGDDAFWDVAVDCRGNLVCSGLADAVLFESEWLAARYRPSGSRRWMDVRSGTSHDAAAAAVAVDAAGNAFVCGSIRNAPARSDILIVKYAPDGRELWKKTLHGSGNGDSEARDVCVDANGACYVCGALFNAGANGQDLWAAKYTAGGRRVWKYVYAGPAGQDLAESIAIDAQRYAYVTGRSEGAATNLNIVTFKLGYERGRRAWMDRVNGPVDADDYGRKIAVAGGAAYVGASSFGGGTTYEDFVAIKYLLDGRRRWVRRYDGPSHLSDHLNGIVVDGRGSLICVGWQVEPAPVDVEALAVKWDASGGLAWARTCWNQATNEGAAFSDVVRGANNTLYCAGADYAGDGQAALLAKYMPSGSRKWRKTWAPAGGRAELNALVRWRPPAGASALFAVGYADAGGAATEDALVTRWAP